VGLPRAVHVGGAGQRALLTLIAAPPPIVVPQLRPPVSKPMEDFLRGLMRTDPATRLGKYGPNEVSRRARAACARRWLYCV
jgi:hypothetical protein